MTDEQIKEPQQEGQQIEAPEEESPSLKEVLIEQAIEGEAPASAKFTLKKVLGGDILSTKTIRDQIWVFLLIAVFMIGYIANRYRIQKNLLEIDRLNTMLQDAKYKALSSSSQLTEKSRESHVLDMLKNNKDSVLKIPSQPPYIVNVPEK
nr:FtsL-like putative cell division protein [uncultured Prevotella sp.]